MIYIKSNNDNSFLFSKDDENFVSLPRIYELSFVSGKVRISNIETGKLLVNDTLISNIEVDGITYDNIEDLSEVLTSLLFNRGGASPTFQPNLLLSSVEPIRLGNTFTYPELSYKAYINSVVEENQNDFVTTINPANASYKRVDLIFIKTGGIIGKKVGTENINVAIRPSLESDEVGISFVNIFGDTISNPTPINNEISIQDNFGTEQFKITDYIRFQGVNFNIPAKTLTIESRVPFTAYLDSVNGNDVTALLETPSKPFATITALLNALPVTLGETYTIYTNAPTVNFTRQISPRNLIWVSSVSTNYDFTNVKMDDGVTDATDIFKIGNATWTFSGENIILRCLSGTKKFSHNSGGYPITIKGNLEAVNWNSQAFIGLGINSNFTINSLYTYSSSQPTFAGQNDINIRIKTIRLSVNQNIISSVGLRSNIVIDSLTQVVSMGTTINYSIGNSLLETISIGSATMNGQLTLTAKRVNYNNTILSDTAYLRFAKDIIHSGKVTSLLYGVLGFTNGQINFLDFIGKINAGRITGNGKAIFDNCSLEVDTYLFNKDASSTQEYSAEFYRYNKITQNNLTQSLIDAKDATSTTITPVKILIAGAVTSNVKKYGASVTAIYPTNTFKEKSKEIVVRSKEDLVNQTLSSDLNYILDGVIELLPTESIIVPVGGLSISGYGFDVSAIKATSANSTIFTSPVGGCGNLFIQNLSFEASGGNSKVFNLTNAGAPTGGADAIELNVVNFDGCDSLGELINFRQGLWDNIGVFGCKDGLTLSGVWSGGFRSDLVIVRNFGISGTASVLFKKGAGLLFKSRFLTDVNADFKLSGQLLDFETSNFDKPKLLQIKGAQVSRGGVLDKTDNYTGIITVNDSVCDWFGNNGLPNAGNIAETDLQVSESSKGLVLTSPDGSKFRMTIDNSGVPAWNSI